MVELSGSRVLVTGADGFIGSHLVERLVAEGAGVRALCLYNSHGHRGWLEDLSPSVRGSIDIRLGDVRDAGLMQDLMRDRELTFHLAALIAIPYSYMAPRSFVETNVLGTQNVLEAARTNGSQVLHTSTSEVYGTPDSLPITESHPLKAQSPYAASKIAADKLAEAYALSFGTDVATVRPFNTFGPRQSMRAVIPTVLAQLLAGTPHIRLGSLHPKRDFTFVADTVSAFLCAARTTLRPGEVVHLGTGSAVSIGEVVELCQEVTGRQAQVLSEDERVRPQASEVDVLLSDPSYASERLGWSAQHPLVAGLDATARWLAERKLTAEEVEHYHR